MADSGGDAVLAVELPGPVRVAASIPVPAEPAHLAASPDGKRVFAACGSGRAIAVIDTETDALVASLPLSGPAYGVAVHPAGTELYAADTGANQLIVYRLPELTALGSVSIGRRAEAVSVSPDGAWVFVANAGSDSVTVVDAATHTIVTTLATLSTPTGVTMRGSSLLVAENVANTVGVFASGTWQGDRTIAVGPSPTNLARAAGGGRVYATHRRAGLLTVIDQQLDVERSLDIGHDTWGVAPHPDASVIYVTGRDGKLSLVDPGGAGVIQTVALGKVLRGVVVVARRPASAAPAL